MEIEVTFPDNEKARLIDDNDVYLIPKEYLHEIHLAWGMGGLATYMTDKFKENKKWFEKYKQ